MPDSKEAIVRAKQGGLRAAALVALLGGSLVAPGVASAAPPDVPPGQDATVTGRPDTLPVASGTVLNPSGQPQIGADVVLLVWPTDAELAALQPGDPVNVQRVGLARTDGSGRYSIRPDYRALRSWLGGRTGSVNVEIVASTADSVAPYSTTMSFDTASERATQVGQPDRTANGTFAEAKAAGTDGLVVDLRLQPAPTAPERSAATTDGLVTSAAPTVPCMTYQADYGPRWVRVGQLYSTAASGFNASFTYNSSATSTLGAGYSLTGAYGSFSQSGTTSNSSSASVGFGALTAAGGKGYSTQYQYGRYYGTGCSPSGVFYYQARPTGFVSGASTANLTTPTANYCTSYDAGSSFTKSTTTAVTWSDGVSITSAIGVNLSSRTGYSTSAKVAFSFSTARRLCGTNDYPGGSPSRLVVK